MSAYALPGLFPAASPSMQKDSLRTPPPLRTLQVSSSVDFMRREEKVDFDDDLVVEDVKVHVTEAKIDTSMLIQSLVASGNSSKPNNNKAARTRCVTSRRTASCIVTPQEECMQFELSISFYGRSYTAVRNLPAFLHLREDLVAELKGQRSALYNNNHCMVPDVPRIDEGVSSRDGVVGRGFAFLHAMMRSYIPTLEGWLREVIRLRPPQDSPSLTHFLWEPVSALRKVESLNSSAMLHLDSIEESENDCEES